MESNANAPCILVVEDSRTQAQELRLVLEQAGFRTVIAHDGEEALRKLGDEAIDLVLSDVVMPGLSGYDLSRAIRNLPGGKHVPVILLTALNDPEDILRGLKSGADNFVIKPFESEVLVQRIRRILERRGTRGARRTAEPLATHDTSFVIDSEKEQILDLLVSTVEEFIRSKQREFEGRLAKESLRNSKDLLQSALDALSAGVAVLDADGRVLAANQVWQQLGGWYHPEEPAEKVRIFDVESPWGQQNPQAMARIRAALVELGEGRRDAFSCEFPAGEDHATWYLVRAHQCAGTSQARIVIAIEDITQRRRAEVERTERLLQEAARARAEAVSRAKDEFMAMLAHELRNPLAPIVAAVEIVRASAADNPVVQDSLEIIDRQVHHLIHLVDDLLDVARATTGKIQLQRSRTSISDVVRDALEVSRPLIDARRHTLEVQLPAEPITIYADASRLAQVVSNLLNNAAKYTEPGGRLWLKVFVDDGRLVLTVRDTGIGIPKDRLPQIFELFTQVDSSLDRSQGGLGIGLSLVRRLVELHGGTVSASSSGPGQGSEFRVELPLSDESAGEGGPREPDAPEEARENTPLRVLVVDDNRDAADTMSMLLRLEKHEVETAYDGLAALETAARFRPDVMLLDIGLPRINGYQVAQRLRESPELRGIHLVALTGYGQEDDRKKALAAGFDDHLLKPVEIHVLRDTLAKVRTASA